MSNSTQFKAGDRAIVLPTKWKGWTVFNNEIGHLIPFNTIVDIVHYDAEEQAYICEWGIGKIAQYLQPHQISPLPIPYHKLDQE